MIKLVAILAIPAALLATVASLGVVFVDVREGGPSGHHIFLPIPLVLAQAAVAFAPDHEARIDVGDVARHLPVAREVLEALAEAPDGELVRVEEPGQQVLVSKVGRALQVRVRERDHEVTVNLPLRMALQILPADGHTISASHAVGALWGARFTDLVEVRDGRDHVKVWVW